MKKKVKLQNLNFKLTKKEVKHVAELAGLTLGPGEIEKFQKQLSEVLSYIEILKKVDTEKIEPTSQVTGLENVFREDKIGFSLSQEEALSGAKNRKNGMFKIRRFLNIK